MTAIEEDGQGTARPCGHDPEELDRTDRNEDAHSIHESRKQIRYTEPGGTRPGDVSSRIDQQQQPIERVLNADQRLGGLVGEQSE
jgi:hypothetical protein